MIVFSWQQCVFLKLCMNCQAISSNSEYKCKWEIYLEMSELFHFQGQMSTYFCRHRLRARQSNATMHSRGFSSLSLCKPADFFQLEAFALCRIGYTKPTQAHTLPSHLHTFTPLCRFLFLPNECVFHLFPFWIHFLRHNSMLQSAGPLCRGIKTGVNWSTDY